MIQGLCGMFENQARAERYNISEALFVCKLVESSPVSPHVIKMVGYIETLDKLGCELKDDLATDVILQSLLASNKSFIMNFHMNGMGKTVAELHGMLKIAEDSIKKKPQSCDDGSEWEEKGKRFMPPKGKGKEKVSDELSSSKTKTKGKSGPSLDKASFHYHKKGH
jgi:hypothetical protein